MDRRTFLKTLAALGVASSTGMWALASSSEKSDGKSDKIGKRLPTRALGRSGEAVTLIGLGGYHIGWTTEALAQATIETALEEGVRFFDTAESYAEGVSEERYGKYVVPRYRDEVFLMSKTTAKNAETAQKHLEGTLRRLSTERLDLWQIHALASPADVDARIENGVIDYALKAREQGKVRHLGFTGHADPHAHLRMLERFPGKDVFLTAQMPVNPVDMVSPFSFVKSVFPPLMERNYGVLAMKSLADGRFFSKKTVLGKVRWESADPIVPDILTVEEVTRFVLSLPVSTLIVGAENPDFLREKVVAARHLQEMDRSARERLAEKVSRFAEVKDVEYYKSRVRA